MGNFVAASEDGSLCVFDGDTYRQLKKWEIPGSRFWCYSCHPRDALVAAGHDRGLIVFKFARETPPYDVQENSVLYVQDSNLRAIDVISKDTFIPTPAPNQTKVVSWNRSKSLAAVSFQADSGEMREIVDLRGKSPILKFEGGSAVWVSRSSVAAIAASKDKLLLHEVGGSSVRSVSVPRSSRIFAAGAQKVYLVSRTTIILFDALRSQKIAEVAFGNAKTVSFDEKRENMCPRNSNAVLIAKDDLSQFAVFNESCKVKSCCWWGTAVLYTTRNHLK
jgi:hypothetical protein